LKLTLVAGPMNAIAIALAPTAVIAPERSPGPPEVLLISISRSPLSQLIEKSLSY
jgi:hypothetical protein